MINLFSHQAGSYGEHSAFFDKVRRLCKEQRLNEALQVVHLLEHKGVYISRDIFYHLLQVCTKKKDLAVARQLHAFFRTRSELKSITVLGDHLIRLFTLCGSLQETNEVFADVPKPSAYTWNAVISAHTKFGEHKRALQLLNRMQQDGVKPNEVTFLCGLKACSNLKAIEQGRLLHDEIAKIGLEFDVVIASTLIDMYAKCGSLEEGHKVFESLPDQNIVSWGALVTGYAMHGHAIDVFNMFTKMQEKGITPSKVIYLGILKACALVGDIELGRLIHYQISRCELCSDLILGTALIDMYSKCGSLEDAYIVFSESLNRNVISWGAMITAYTQHGHGDAALELFQEMQHEGIEPDNVILSCIVKACGNTGIQDHGRVMHDVINRNGLASDAVLGSSLVDMYVKFGSLEEAYRVFEILPNKNIVSWGAMMAGYAQHEDGLTALHLFEKMEQEGIKPDRMILMCVAKACGSFKSIVQGRLVHNQIVCNELELDAPISGNLVDMYAKYGSIHEACKVFEGLRNPDVVSWGSVIAAYAQCGNYRMVSQGLDIMQQQALKPDDVMFTTILTVCSHAGLMEEGLHYFNSMRENHGIGQNIEHYNCIIDLVSRAGHLHEAEDMLATMPIIPNITGWVSLLTSCKTYGNTELGSHCLDHIIRSDPKDASAYVLMSSTFAEWCMWEDFERLEKRRKCAGLVKVPGRASIDVDNQLHEFIVGEGVSGLSLKLKRFSKLLKNRGYLPRVDIALEIYADKDHAS